MPRLRGKTKVLSQKEIRSAFSAVKKYRYSEKNTAILRLAFDYGMTAKEIAALKVSDIALLDETNKIIGLSNQLMIRNGLNLAQQARSEDQVGFNITKEELSQVVSAVAEDARLGCEISAKNYYPAVKRRQKSRRVLPLINLNTRQDLKMYLAHRSSRLNKYDNQAQIANEPFILSQKNVFYSPNTLQEHIKLILAEWAGISGATSLSGRATLVKKMTNLGIQLKDIQLFLGHVCVSTTALYSDIQVEPEFLSYDLRSNKYIHQLMSESI